MDLSSLLQSENASFLDQAYQAWLRDPTSVDRRWADLFQTWERPSVTPRAGPTFQARSVFNPTGLPSGGAVSQADRLTSALRQARVARLINAYRVRGHLEADIDPLRQLPIQTHPELTLEYYGLTSADLDEVVSGHGVYGVPEVTTPRVIISRLRRAYCGTFGVEFMNIHDTDKKAWLQERFETLQDRPTLSHAEEIEILRKLSDAEGFETLLHNRFPGTKRFSLEGAETLIPLLDLLIERLVEGGADEVVFGMPHRGRLSVLANILRKPIRFILNEFEDTRGDSFQGSGDVKYHLGYAASTTTRTGMPVRLLLAFNPSHLEAVDPVVEGRVRARQDRRGATGREGRSSIVPVLLHGDAAFAGQGLVAEVLNLSDLKGYRTGGTVHVVVNNQIGFTTAPRDARSTPYCTDVARMLAVPIFHVNGEDPIAVTQVVAIAAEWRQTFGQDVIIDMYCYRKHGHNEGDEPSFTQPLLYETIRSKPSPRVAYARKMIGDGDLSQREVDQIFGESNERMGRAVTEDVPLFEPQEPDPTSPLAGLWARYRRGSAHDEVDTRVPQARLSALITEMCTPPSTFHAHKKIERLLAQRLEMARGERPVDWAVGELLAYATLVTEGFRVRLSGQDSGRGTFSHRHAVLTDIQDGSEHVALQHLADRKAPFDVFDSLLSEAGVLGFEFGYSLDAPDALVLWEAQFGDFANGAQVIIDNFLTASEQKWNRASGLVLLLPHGYEGQGPEHSSARLERYLQLCAEDNIFVANCTTPASFYHLLRRQMHLQTRKPLVVMTPKSLLRNPRCVSSLAALAEGRFERVIADALPPEPVRRAVLCSGKVYYDLLDEREKRGETRVAILRLEQLHPFPGAEILAELGRYPHLGEVVWCQEEPRNMGPWPMVDEWLSETLGGRTTRYAGRKAAASPATGSPSVHRREQAALIADALTLA